MFVLIVCSFMGGTLYECDQGLTFQDEAKCESYAREVDDAKGLSAYCVTNDVIELRDEVSEI